MSLKLINFFYRKLNLLRFWLAKATANANCIAWLCTMAKVGCEWGEVVQSVRGHKTRSVAAVSLRAMENSK
jgi:hypothetical protein